MLLVKKRSLIVLIMNGVLSVPGGIRSIVKVFESRRPSRGRISSRITRSACSGVGLSSMQPNMVERFVSSRVFPPYPEGYMVSSKHRKTIAHHFPGFRQTWFTMAVMIRRVSSRKRWVSVPRVSLWCVRGLVSGYIWFHLSSHGFTWKLNPFDILVVYPWNRREARPLIAVGFAKGVIALAPSRGEYL